jgi:hypothetical protein
MAHFIQEDGTAISTPVSLVDCKLNLSENKPVYLLDTEHPDKTQFTIFISAENEYKTFLVTLHVTYEIKITDDGFLPKIVSIQKGNSKVCLSAEEGNYLQKEMTKKFGGPVYFENCKEPYAVAEYYSWGESRDPYECESYEAALKKMQQLAITDACASSEDNHCFIEIKSYTNDVNEKATILLRYRHKKPENDTYGLYELVRLKKVSRVC